jgi:hypothetical protein
MKSFSLLTAVFAAGLTASAAIQVTVCDPADLHPLWIQEVMVGTQVSLVVHSDSDALWGGGLFIHDADRGRGVLSSRNSGDPNDPAGQASCLEAAGPGAFILGWNDSKMSGFDLYSDELTRRAGKWFVLDYTPRAEGDCTIHYYDHNNSFTVEDPNLQVPFVNTATRDFNKDGVVNFEDFSIFATSWQTGTSADPNAAGRADLDHDGSVGLVDVLMFADFWLWGTPNWQRTPYAAPESEVPVDDPDVFYAIVDPNGQSEVSIPVGDSVRLYLTKTTLDENVYIFSLEATISDPNRGWIDNTSRDPNALLDLSTAELLATPRSAFFDYWGPGYTQAGGIQFLAASFGGPMDDGVIASFVYTATAVGDVTLSLVDHVDTVPSGLQSILLHQYAPQAEPMMMSASSGDGTTTVQPISETVEMLEAIWEESPDVREVIAEEEWIEFIDAVKESIESESLE